MELTKDQIKDWLNTPSRSREWLAEQCDVTLKTVNNWLSSPIQIPNKGMRIIEQLYAADQEKARAASPTPSMSLVLEVDADRFDAYNRAALSERMIIRDWAIDVLDRAATRDRAAGVVPTIANFPTPEELEPKYFLDLHGGVAAGERITAMVHPEPVAVAKAYPEGTYLLRVFGTSMEKEGDPDSIPDGSLIAVRAMKDPGYPRQGTTIIYSDGMGSTLKIFGYRKAQPSEMEFANRMGMIPTLSSLNPDFPEVQTMEGGKIDAVFVEVVA